MKEVYAAADLPELADLLPAARLGVVGNPIAHSLSPPMQQAALDAQQRAATYVRLLCEKDDGAFPALIRRLQGLGFIGVNVTVPFKRQAFAVADEADALSTLCGAANTLVFREGGKISCYNTDGPGFERAVIELAECPLSKMRVLLLGACGGAGSALAAQCVLSGVPLLFLVNRPRPELAQLAESLRPHNSRCELRTISFSDPALREAMAEADLIVNATSLGLAEDHALPLPAEWLQKKHTVYDIVTHATPFGRAAGEKGCRVSDGRSMLLWQGALAYERWYGELPPVEAMSRALRAAGV